MKRSRKRRWWKKALKILGLILVAGIVGGEVYFRIAYYEELKLRTYPLVYQPDSLYGYRYMPGTLGRICLPDICKDFQINEQGFISGKNYQKKKTPGRLRLAVIGTSQATGIWMAGQENFGEKLEQRLISEGHDAEVYNFSIDGRYRDDKTQTMALEVIRNYQPDIMFIAVYIPFMVGDFSRDQYRDYVLIYKSGSERSLKRCKDRIDHIEGQWFFNTLYRASYIVRALSRKYYYSQDSRIAQNLKIFVEKRMQDHEVLIWPTSVLKSMRKMRALRDSMAAYGGHFYTISYDAKSFMNSQMHLHCIDHIDLDMEMRPGLVHKRDIHYNEKGHEVITNLLYQAIEEKGILPSYEARQVRPERGIQFPPDPANRAQLAKGNF